MDMRPYEKRLDDGRVLFTWLSSGETTLEEWSKDDLDNLITFILNGVGGSIHLRGKEEKIYEAAHKAYYLGEYGPLDLD